MRRFVLHTEPLAQHQEALLAAQFPAPTFGWWHWLPNVWLIYDPSSILTATIILERFRTAAPDQQCLVLEIEGTGNWAGNFTTDTARRDPMTNWLSYYWGPKTLG